MFELVGDGGRLVAYAMRCGSRFLTFWIRVAVLKTRGTDVARLGMCLAFYRAEPAKPLASAESLRAATQAWAERGAMTCCCMVTFIHVVRGWVKGLNCFACLVALNSRTLWNQGPFTRQLGSLRRLEYE